MNRQRNDIRKEQIASAFMEMMEETCLEDLRIYSLCHRAKVSRATFYRLFPDKYEVGNWIYKSRAEKIIEEHPKLRCWNEWTMLIFSEIQKNGKFYRSIASYRGQNSFLDFLTSFYYGNVIEFRDASILEPTCDQKFAIRMFSLIGAQVTVDWIMQGFTPLPEEVQRRVELCIPDCIRAFYK